MYVIEVDLGTEMIHKDAKSIQLEDIEKLQELSKTVKSPYLADLERRVNPYK